MADGRNLAFPLYDGHGKMIATLLRVEGTTQYQVSNLRSFDAWGGVRSGNPTSGPSQRYCASLGHVQDDESSLIYMRARYYEPTTGRFISEDPARDGDNWFLASLAGMQRAASFSAIAATTTHYQALFLAAWILGGNGPENRDQGLISSLAFTAIGATIAVAEVGRANVLLRDVTSVVLGYACFLSAFMALTELEGTEVYRALN